MSDGLRGKGSSLVRGPRLYILISLCVVVWYPLSTFLPRALGSCVYGSCEPGLPIAFVSIALPLLLTASPFLLEMAIFKRSPSAAFHAFGFTNINRRVLGVTALFVAPLLVYFPLLAAVTGSTLIVAEGFVWLIVGSLLSNGLNEETLVRGFIFRHVRERHAFWPAAAIATLYFAAYHVPLIVLSGPLVGSIGVIVAIPTGFLMAYLYELGRRSIPACILVHVGNNVPVFIFSVGAVLQPMATAIYLVLAIVTATAILVGAKWRGLPRAAMSPSATA